MDSSRNRYKLRFRHSTCNVGGNGDSARDSDRGFADSWGLGFGPGCQGFVLWLALLLVESLLKLTLEAAVPLWILKIQDENWPWDRLQAEAKEAAQIVAEKGDIIQFRSKKKGETAAAFNALAKGLSILAFAPGGVTFLGLHWEVDLMYYDDINKVPLPYERKNCIPRVFWLDRDLYEKLGEYAESEDMTIHDAAMFAFERFLEG